MKIIVGVLNTIMMSHHKEADQLKAWEAKDTTVLVLNRMKDTMNHMVSTQNKETIMATLTDHEKVRFEWELAEVKWEWELEEGKWEWEDLTEKLHLIIIIIRKAIMHIKKNVIMINKSLVKQSQARLLNH